MLDLVKAETERIDSRFLEPACGSGNFLVQVLRRKLAAVELKFGKSEFEKRQLRTIRSDVYLRHRALARQHRRMSRQHAGDSSPTTWASTTRMTSTEPPPTCFRRTSSTVTP